MKRTLCSVLIALVVSGGVGLAASFGNAFTYQGRLTDSGAPAQGLYDLRFTLYSASSGGVVVAGPLTNSPVGVANGLFAVVLDFGPGVFTGEERWLETAVRTNGRGSFTLLSGRQPLTPSPYAIYAPSAGSAATASAVANNAITASGIASGNVVKSLNNLRDVVTLSAGTNVSLSAVGNDIRISATAGALATNAGWTLAGNAGTGATNFLGTTDGQALELRVNGVRALRLEPNASGAPNVIAGAPPNRVGAGVIGAVIAGGGAASLLGGSYTNRVDDSFSIIGGGVNNWIQSGSYESLVAGGCLHTIQGGSHEAGILSGYHNTIQSNAPGASIVGGREHLIGLGASFAAIGGGDANTNRGAASVIGGGSSNMVVAGAHAAVLSGGSKNFIGSRFASISGGNSNIANGAYSAIGSGRANITVGDFSVLGGGLSNENDADHGFLGGGQENWLQASDAAFLGGGWQNYIYDMANCAYLGGGQNNSVGLEADHAVMVGGQDNGVDEAAHHAAILGGSDNWIGSGAYLATIGGGAHNRVNGAGGAVLGGNGNQANGVNSFAAGTHARAEHYGSFVWADGNYTDFASTASHQFLIRAAGGVGINTTSPQQNLSVANGMNIDQNALNNGNATNILTFGSGSGEGIGSKRTVGGNRFGLDFYTSYAPRMAITQGGRVGIGTNSPAAALHVSPQAGSDAARFDGTVLVNVLTIMGGADVAEPFPMADPSIPKGAVVIIDDEHPGQLKLSDRAYDTRVAGIVSGANGINPGLTLHQEGAMAGGRNVALTGRVYVQADTANGPIKPGDLLTTSSTPGHAMKVADHGKAQGAILGKAMTSLQQGQGMVLVLVTLQ